MAKMLHFDATNDRILDAARVSDQLQVNSPHTMFMEWRDCLKQELRSRQEPPAPGTFQQESQSCHDKIHSLSVLPDSKSWTLANALRASRVYPARLNFLT